MIIHDKDETGKPIEQGSADWFELRRGIATTSEFDKIVTTAGKRSSQAVPYMARLLAERLLDESFTVSLDQLEHIQRGKEMEPFARQAYSVITGDAVRQVAFVTDDHRRWGCSPDGLLPDLRPIEIKSPAPPAHMLYRIEPDHSKYKAQRQGQILLLKSESAVFFSFNARMPHVLIETPRDTPFIRLLAGELRWFSDTLDQWEETVRADGFFDVRRAPTDIVGDAYAESAHAEMDRLAGSYGAENVWAG